MQSCMSDLGYIPLIASGNPVNPSMQKTKTSLTPLLLSSVKT